MLPILNYLFLCDISINNRRGKTMNKISFFSVACALVYFSIGLFEAHADVLEPGKTLTLTSTGDPVPADGTDIDCAFIPLLGPTCQTDSGGQYFGARTFAPLPFSRSQGTASQWYDIDIAGGNGLKTALLSQISGKATFNGFIALVGGGQVKGALTLEVIDLGPTDAKYPNGGKVVYKDVLANHQFKGTTSTGLNFGIKIEGGAPYIGAGAGPEFKFNVALKKELVRDNVEFGIHVLLIRGRSYRIKFKTNVLAKKGGIGGLAIAQFMLGDDRAPDMIDPNNWIDGINGLIDSTVPSIQARGMNLQEKSDGIFGFFDKERILSGPRGATTAQQILSQLGLPTSFKEIVEKRLKRSGILEERIPNPGAEVNELFITLQTDQVEILNQHTVLLEHIIDLQNTPPGRRPSFPLK
jgi:hypothetical protein